MLGLLIAVRNAVIIVLLAWLGLDAPSNEKPSEESVERGAAMSVLGLR